MFVSTKSCHGGTMIHDATLCAFCVHTNLFYTIFRPALARLYKLNNCSPSTDDHEMCGIMTFLEGCFQFGFITNDAKSNILSVGNPPDSFDYTPLLDSIVNAKKNFKSRPTCTASIRALLYKYKKKAVKTNEKKQSVPKDHFEDCLQESALPCKDEEKPIATNETRRRVSKRHFDNCPKDPTSALFNQRKRNILKTNETKQSAPKRKCCKDPIPAILNKRKRNALRTNEMKQSALKRKCLKYPTSALLNKRKRKALKTNKTKLSAGKNRSNDIHKDSTSTVGRKKSKAPKPKSKKAVDKIPTKGTLKRKRWLVKQMETEENYEDDIFENSSLYRLSKFDQVSLSSSDYSNRAGTPTWEYKLSPRPESPLPDFEDDDDVIKLKKFIKDAEEYQHRRQKRRETSSKTEPQKKPSNEVKEETRDVNIPQPSCSYAAIKPPLKNENRDGDELLDDC